MIGCGWVVEELMGLSAELVTASLAAGVDAVDHKLELK
jgi:hypothetical protein